MRRKIGKHIVYIDYEYFNMLCLHRRVKTDKDRSDLYQEIIKEVIGFIEGKKSVFFANLFIDSTGKRRRAIEITPLLSFDNKKTLHYIRKTNKRRRQ